ncbi:MAG: FprA family A-type flavoprotein, partial [Raoultibacter sp.]
MLHALEVKPDIYWVGGIDWNERNFHGYTTDRGSTYNAYLIMDEHVTLIDTCKATFAPELIERISEIVDPAKIEYLVANHVEMDHSGALPDILALAPNATVVCSDPHGIKGLRAHFGERDYLPVKSGDTLCIGKRTLQFTHTMMVHWPDNMVTYSAFDRILFSN